MTETAELKQPKFGQIIVGHICAPHLRRRFRSDFCERSPRSGYTLIGITTNKAPASVSDEKIVAPGVS